MSRATHPRPLLLLVGALVVTAGLIWSGGHRSRVEAKAPAETAAVVAAPAPVAPQAATPPPVAHTAQSQVKAAAGMRIFLDPETGEIGPPTAAATGLETEANSEDMTGLQQVQLPDGSYMVDLQGRFEESMVIQLDANGHRVVSCTRDVKKTLAHPPTPQREDR